MPQTDRSILFQHFFETLTAFHRVLAASKEQLRQGSTLNRAQLELLLRLEHMQPAAIGQIAESMMVSSSAATQLVDELVKLELVERTEDQQDRRRMQVKLSPHGMQKLTIGKQAFFAMLEKRLDGIDEKDLEIVTNHLQHMIDKMQEFEKRKV